MRTCPAAAADQRSAATRAAFLTAVHVQTMSIVRISVSNGATELLASLQNERPALTGVGIWTGLAPDGSLLTLRDLCTQELYSVELSGSGTRFCRNRILKHKKLTLTDKQRCRLGR